MNVHCASETVAVSAERRWACIVIAIIVLLLAMMVWTGLHWAAMPPSRVETVDVRTLHLKGEFVENNLGTAVEKDGRVVVRLVGQQYSFVPQCIVVPAGVPVTFRGTSSDAIHGFVVGRTNANTMLIPGFIATFTTTFPKAGEQLMPCHEYCGTGHEAMWARFQVIPADEFFARAKTAERISCVPG
ncbi:cytochrome C oxidase subunit II [Janthinobacterium psychrotolerans]|uniref:Cytochrome c oxidase subunit 2 n=1 Tax=Janthinobacterium psychrotolerans TaxID=1747903 RepID=A0A1A7C008_9BURK|nr:cytochrome C oxidase subunit II [Janthinobacterium psychrotolerans]OBV37663.1 cytochrome c oxidase subunit 2 [Janthinobacterium psychrotolerans]